MTCVSARAGREDGVGLRAKAGGTATLTRRRVADDRAIALDPRRVRAGHDGVRLRAQRVKELAVGFAGEAARAAVLRHAGVDARDHVDRNAGTRAGRRALAAPVAQRRVRVERLRDGQLVKAGHARATIGCLTRP
jgi:hypothetical protein